jgi:pyruvate,water dikinase
MRPVLFPEEIQPSSPVGGKARALVDLERAELPIPPWCVVLPHAFEASLEPAQATALAAARDAEAARAVVDGVLPSAEVARAIREAAAAVAGGGEVAVRSSALEEDSAERSFAGQLESFLFVAPPRAPEYVARVWRSGFGERLIAYRREAGLPGLPRAPAVVIQSMVEGEVSGVAFSADPVSGRRGVAVVAAVPGLGAGLVGGASDADTWRVDREDRVVEATLRPKPFAQRRDPSAPGGVAVIPLQGEDSTRPALEPERVIEVAALARRAEAFAGRPQDIEWTYRGRRLYLLQSRPITGLEGKTDPDGLRAIWDNANIVESYAGVTTPLTFSFARRAYEHVYRQFCRLMRVDEATVEAHAEVFCCMLGLVRGRVYYNLLNWYRLLALLPGYRFNRRFLEQMIGVREDLAEEAVPAPAPGGHLADGPRLLATLWGLLLAYLGLGRRVRRFYARVAATLGSGPARLARLRPEELAREYRRIEQRLLTRWDAPVVNDFAAMVCHGLLRRLLVAWAGESRADALQGALLGAEPGMVSSEPAERVRRMARMAAGSPALVDALCAGTPLAIRAEVRRHPELARAIQAYLERFGDRCLEELKLESPTLLDDPLPLLRSVGRQARGLPGRAEATPREPEATLRREADEEVRRALAGHPLRRLVLARVLRAARARIRDRENLRFERTRVFGRARLIAVEIGRRLAALGCLVEARDVFYLEVDEMLAYVEGRATTTDLKGLVALRRQELDRCRAEPPPAERFETRGVVYVGHGFQRAAPHTPPTGDSLQGLGCSPGLVRGPVRIVRDPYRESVSHGEVIVAERTDPGWVMIFPLAAGLLVERGSLLSHSAIVARELGLPTIVSLQGLTGWLADGDWVEMDGGSGRVTRIRRPAGAA